MKCLHITGKYHPHFRIYLRVFKTMLLCLAIAHGSKDSEVRRTRLQMTKWLLCINVYNPILYYINYTCICSVSSQKSTLQNVWGSLGTVTWENSVGIQSCNWFQKDKNNGMWTCSLMTQSGSWCRWALWQNSERREETELRVMSNSSNPIIKEAPVSFFLLPSTVLWNNEYWIIQWNIKNGFRFDQYVSWYTKTIHQSFIYVETAASYWKSNVLIQDYYNGCIHCGIHKTGEQ